MTDTLPSNGDSTIRRLQKLIYVMAAVVVVMVVHAVIMQIQLTNRNSTLDDIQKDSGHIAEYVDELESRPALDLQPVFRAVFDIRQVVCAEFPDNEVCADS